MIDEARFNDSADERNPTVVGSGRYRQLTDAEVKLMRAVEALQQIRDMGSCLLAHAQEIAREALEDIHGE